MKEYLPGKTEVSMLIFGIGLGIVLVVSTARAWTLAMLFVWPIFFIAMPLVYIIGKRKDNLDKKMLKSKLSSNIPIPNKKVRVK